MIFYWLIDLNYYYYIIRLEIKLVKYYNFFYSRWIKLRYQLLYKSKITKVANFLIPKTRYLIQKNSFSIEYIISNKSYICHLL